MTGEKGPKGPPSEQVPLWEPSDEELEAHYGESVSRSQRRTRDRKVRQGSPKDGLDKRDRS